MSKAIYLQNTPIYIKVTLLIARYIDKAHQSYV